MPPKRISGLRCDEGPPTIRLSRLDAKARNCESNARPQYAPLSCAHSDRGPLFLGGPLAGNDRASGVMRMRPREPSYKPRLHW